jgi:hypothetical protein
MVYPARVSDVTSSGQACNISRTGSNRRRNIGLVLALACAAAAAAVLLLHAPVISRIGVGVLALAAGVYLFQVKEKT